MVATVDPDAVEIANTTAFDKKDGITLVAASFDVSAARLDYTVIDPKDGTFGTVPGADGFNGFSATFAALASGSGVSLNAVDVISADTDAVLAPAKITLTSDSLFVDLQGLRHVGGETLALLLGFRINGTSGADVLLGNAGRDLILGAGGADQLRGAGGSDQINGGNGRDTLDGGAGADEMTGGAGDDQYLVDDAGDQTIERRGGGTDTVTSSITWTLASQIETLILTGGGRIDGTGNALANRITGTGGRNVLAGLDGNDTLLGGGGNDRLSGGAGRDELRGGTGADTMTGGGGDDTYYADDTADRTTENAGGGTDQVFSSVDWTLSDNVENLTLVERISVAPGSRMAGPPLSGLTGTGNGGDNILTGNSDDNALNGEGGNDTLVGLGGNDGLDGGIGADSMVGGIGDDTYYVDDLADITAEAAGGGTDSVIASLDWILAAEVENLALAGTQDLSGTGNRLNNLLQGNSGRNTLTGLGGTDTLLGGGGRDTLRGGSGADSMVGGGDNDVYYVDDAGDTTREGESGGTDRVIAALDWTLSGGVENLTLAEVTPVSDGPGLTGIGNTGNNSITGNSDANRLGGLDGNDSLFGGLGRDTLNGGTGADLLTGGQDDDLYFVDDAGDQTVEEAGGGTDLVLAARSWTLGDEVENLTLTGNLDSTGDGNALNNLITGNAGNNALSGRDGDDTLIGGQGRDTLRGGVGADDMTGGAGSDTYFVDETGDRIHEAEGGGTDLVLSSINLKLATDLENLTLQGLNDLTASGNLVANILTGNVGANQIYGDDGDDSLFGGDGNDTLNGGTGADSLDGGDGDDVYRVDNALDTVTEAEGHGIDTVVAGLDWILSDNVENLVLDGTDPLSGTGNLLDNRITGNVGDNLLDGLDGDNTLLGGAGFDTLIGGTGNDRLDGGADFDQMEGGTGDDLYIVDNSDDGVSDTGGNDSIQSSIDWSLSDDTIEHLFLTGALQLTGVGSFGADDIHANDAGNQLIGGEGNDTLTGGLGDDGLFGDTEDDQIFGGNGADTLDGSDGSDLLQGDTGDDELYGGDDSDALSGGAGIDLLDGGSGDDQMAGGADDDAYYVDSDLDQITENASDGTDTVYTDLSFTLGANLENLIIGGESSVTGIGNAENNLIMGNFNINTLSGLGGDDTIYGGEGGGDLLSGGSGFDQFITELGGGLDEIGDFEDGIDFLIFSGLDSGETTVSIFEDSLSGGTYVMVADDGFFLAGISASQIDFNDYLLT